MVKSQVTHIPLPYSYPGPDITKHTLEQIARTKSEQSFKNNQLILEHNTESFTYIEMIWGKKQSIHPHNGDSNQSDFKRSLKVKHFSVAEPVISVFSIYQMGEGAFLNYIRKFDQ